MEWKGKNEGRARMPSQQNLSGLDCYRWYNVARVSNAFAFEDNADIDARSLRIN